MELETQDVVVVEGEKLHLNIPYRAIPTPKMLWQKDAVECKADERLSMTVEMNSAHLDLLKCARADAGVYTITLENILGTATGAVNVIVIGRSSHFVLAGQVTFCWQIVSLQMFRCSRILQDFLVNAKTSAPVTSPRTPVRSAGQLQRMTEAHPLSATRWSAGKPPRRPTCPSCQESMC